MKKIFLSVLKKIAPVLLLSTAMQASAALVATTHTGFGAGTLDGVDFAGAFVISAVADTSTITPLDAGGFSNINISATIYIDSTTVSGVFSFLAPTSYLSTEDGIAFARPDHTSLFDGPVNTSTWDMASTIKLPPLGEEGFANLLQWGDGLQTSGGTLMFHDGITLSAFAAIAEAPEVPLPAGVWLFGSGLVGLIGIARRKAQSH